MTRINHRTDCFTPCTWVWVMIHIVDDSFYSCSHWDSFIKYTIPVLILFPPSRITTVQLTKTCKWNSLANSISPYFIQSQVSSCPPVCTMFLHSHIVSPSLLMQHICSCSLQTSPCTHAVSYSVVTLILTGAHSFSHWVGLYLLNMSTVITSLCIDSMFVILLVVWLHC